MSSPFAGFRKHQKTILAVVCVICMIVFTIDSGMRSFMGNRGGGSISNPTVVSWSSSPITDAGSLTESDIAQLVSQTNAMRTFIKAQAPMAQFTQSHPLLPLLCRFGADGRPTPSSDEEVVDITLMARRGEKLGIEFGDDSVRAFLREITNNKLNTVEDVQRAVRDSKMPHFETGDLYRIMRLHLVAAQLRTLAWGQASLAPPSETWEHYVQLNRRITAELYPVKVADFIPKLAAEPTETELKTLYEKYKKELPNPNSPVPGFMKPRKIGVEAIAFRFNDALNEEMQKLDGDEARLRAEYEKNKESYVKPELPELPAASTDPKAVLGDRTPPADLPKTPGDRPQSPGDLPQTAGDAPNPPGDLPKAPAEAPKPPAEAPKTPAETPKAPAEPAKTPADAPKTPAEGSKPAADPAPSTPPEKKVSTPSSTDTEFFTNLEGDKPADEKKPDEKKPDEKKPDEKKPDEKKPDEKKPDEKKPDEKKPDEKKPDEKKPDEKKPDEKKPDEKKPDEKKPDEKKPEERKPEEKKPDEKKPEEKKPEEKKPEEKKPEEKPAPVKKYRTFEEVKEEIKRNLAVAPAGQLNQRRMKAVFDRMNEYKEKYLQWQVEKEGEDKRPVAPDLKSLAAEFHGTYSVQTSNGYEFGGTDVGQSVTNQLETGRQTPLIYIYFGQSNEFYRPTETIGGGVGGLISFISWKLTDEAEAEVKFEEAREQVKRAFQMQKALELAEQEAKEIAAKARKNKGPLAESLGADLGKSVVVTNEAMQWSVRQDGQPMRPDIVALSGDDGEIRRSFNGVESRKALFALKYGEVGTVTNEPHTVVYVARVSEDKPGEDYLKSRFLEEIRLSHSGVYALGLSAVRNLDEGWREDLRTQSKLVWNRSPRSRPGDSE